LRVLTSPEYGVRTPEKDRQNSGGLQSVEIASAKERYGEFD